MDLRAAGGIIHADKGRKPFCTALQSNSDHTIGMCAEAVLKFFIRNRERFAGDRFVGLSVSPTWVVLESPNDEIQTDSEQHTDRAARIFATMKTQSVT